MREYPINLNIYTGSVQTCPGIPKALGLRASGVMKLMFYIEVDICKSIIS